VNNFQVTSVTGDDKNGYWHMTMVPVSQKTQQTDRALWINPATYFIAPVRPLLPTVKYSEDQPRDDHGRWTSGGDLGSAQE
jgi:hypothetical protein